MQETLTYRERGLIFLHKARSELEAGDFEQASEKAWGAAAMMVKAVAQQRGLNHKNHAVLSDVVDELVEELQDHELRRQYDVAQALHTNFYENRFTDRGIRPRIEDVEQFVDKMARILNTAP